MSERVHSPSHNNNFQSFYKPDSVSNNELEKNKDEDVFPTEWDVGMEESGRPKLEGLGNIESSTSSRDPKLVH